MQVLTLVFELDGLGPLRMLDAISGLCVRHGISLDAFTLQAEAMTMDRIVATLKRTKRQGFVIASPEFEVTLRCVRHYRLNSVSVKAERHGTIPWSEWVSELVNEKFISAWLAHAEYEYWQNA